MASQLTKFFKIGTKFINPRYIKTIDVLPERAIITIRNTEQSNGISHCSDTTFKYWAQSDPKEYQQIVDITNKFAETW